MKNVVNDLKKAFNTGVSYMMPATVAGGIFLAIALATGQAGKEGMVVNNPFFQNLLTIGSAGFAMMIPMLAGYISYSLAGKPGLVPGMIVGYIANQPIGPDKVQTGFLGAMILGIMAGYIARRIKKWKVKSELKAIMPILVVPILTTGVVALIYMYVLVGPLGFVMNALVSTLKNLQGGNALILGLIIGLMTAFDMGGPMNKTASAFTLALMAEGIYGPNGAFRIAVAVPPLALAVSTIVSRKKYDDADKDLGKAALVMGLIGITEGAIPFAVKDLKRVIPAIMIGSAIGAGLGMLHGVDCYVPHGGLIVLPAVTGKLWFFIDMMIGVAVSVILLHFLKPNLEESVKK